MNNEKPTCEELERQVAELRRERDFLRIVIDSIPQPLAVKDRDHRWILINKVIGDVFRMPVEDLIGKTDYDLIRKEEADIFRAIEEEVFKTGKPISNEEKFTELGGRERWQVAEKSLISDPDGNKYLLAIAHDITDRKRAEEQMEKSHELLSNLACLVPGVIYQYRLYPDGSSAFPYSSPGINDIYEVTTEDVREDATVAFGRLHPDDRDHVSNAIMESARTLQTFLCEFRVILPRQGLRWRWSQAHPERMADGGTLWHGIISDITDRKTAEEMQKRMHDLEKHVVVGKVAGKMAHDFNNVLGIILGTCELLQIGKLPPEVKTDIDIIMEYTLKGRDLTRNLVMFAKDQEPKLSQFDLNEKVDMVMRSLKSELMTIAVSLNYGDGMDKLLADAGLLENALINLVKNSIHALSKTEKPILIVRTYSAGDNICMEVRDNGCGIPPEHMDRIFEPMFTLKGSADNAGAYKKDIKGSGYGLANVKRFVEKHDGKISVDSQVGKGTRITISLPLIKGHFSAEEMKTILDAQEAVEGKRILIVEDEPHLGRILHSLLAKFNHSIDIAENGKAAVDLCKRNSYDAVSLDYTLPDMNGMEIYLQVRETDKDIPIIFVSGNFEFMQSMIDLKKEDPKVDHLAKPFKTVEYVNKVHSWL